MKKTILALGVALLAACSSQPDKTTHDVEIQVAVDTLNLDSAVEVPLTEEQHKVIDSVKATVPAEYLDSLRTKAKAKLDSIVAAKDTTTK